MAPSAPCVACQKETELKLKLLDEPCEILRKIPKKYSCSTETFLDLVYRTSNRRPDTSYCDHLGIVERKDEHSMLRYLSVVDDMKSTAIPLTTGEWTSAISFASRYVARSTEVEVESALHMWREMEHIAGVKGTDGTFNVLFDVACKAGKFTLAEMIYKEMHARGFEFNRFHHVSQIHYYGLKGDGDGARAAYKTLVEAGEIVDTVVLNAMISALITAHEPNAAENIYERMKKIHLESSGSALQPRNYKSRRVINAVLMKMAKIVKAEPDETAGIPEAVYCFSRSSDISIIGQLLRRPRW